MECAGTFTTPWSNSQTLRDHISNKEGPLTKALDSARDVCRQCDAVNEWKDFESYLLNCLYKNVPAVPGFLIPPPRQKGRLGIPADQEVLRPEMKNLTIEIENFQKAVLERMQADPTANHAMVVSALVCCLNKQISVAFTLLMFFGSKPD